MTRVLLLNADYSPLRVLSWQRAVCLMFSGRVHAVANYDDEIRSPSLSLPRPAVVCLTRYVRAPRDLAWSRRGVFARDEWTCQYCGEVPGVRNLTLDHVVPRSRAVRGKVTLPSGERVSVNSWLNVVAACEPCNLRKGAKLPREARMKLARRPGPPSAWERIRILLGNLETLPCEWGPWI